jgi:hypothetical protein
VRRQRITNQICKEYPFEPPLSGKFDFHNKPLYDSKSMAWAFFTDDEINQSFDLVLLRRAFGQFEAMLGYTTNKVVSDADVERAADATG